MKEIQEITNIKSPNPITIEQKNRKIIDISGTVIVRELNTYLKKTS